MVNPNFIYLFFQHFLTIFQIGHMGFPRDTFSSLRRRCNLASINPIYTLIIPLYSCRLNQLYAIIFYTYLLVPPTLLKSLGIAYLSFRHTNRLPYVLISTYPSIATTPVKFLDSTPRGLPLFSLTSPLLHGSPF